MCRLGRSAPDPGPPGEGRKGEELHLDHISPPLASPVFLMFHSLTAEGNQEFIVSANLQMLL